jgi:glutamate synthase (NADPH/NADH) large chain
MNVSARDKAPRGLYDAAYEHDACGVAFVARLRAPASHEVVERALEALERLEHRGAAGADAETGDGAGILLQCTSASRPTPSRPGSWRTPTA